VTVDNSFTAYVNGKAVGTGSDWSKTYNFHFDAPCDDGGVGNVYAIHGLDSGGPAAAIASVENCGSTSNTRLARSRPQPVLSLRLFPFWCDIGNPSGRRSMTVENESAALVARRGSACRTTRVTAG
jgi:hypothetical protein